MSATLNHEVEILSRLEVEMTQAGARDLLKMAFSAQDQQRMIELLEKGSRGTRTPEEDQEAHDLKRLGYVLSMLKSVARRTLKQA